VTRQKSIIHESTRTNTKTIVRDASCCFVDRFAFIRSFQSFAVASPPLWSGFGPAADEVNNLDSIAFVQSGCCPLIATHNAAVKFDRYSRWL
jgi:hypothetical protein